MILCMIFNKVIYKYKYKLGLYSLLVYYSELLGMIVIIFSFFWVYIYIYCVVRKGGGGIFRLKVL